MGTPGYMDLKTAIKLSSLDNGCMISSTIVARHYTILKGVTDGKELNTW